MKQPETKTIALRYGVKDDGGHVTSLSMRPPRARDSRDAQQGAKGPGDMEITLFANLCQVPPTLIEELHMADYRLVQDAYESFLG